MVVAGFCPTPPCTPVAMLTFVGTDVLGIHELLLCRLARTSLVCNSISNFFSNELQRAKHKCRWKSERWNEKKRMAIRKEIKREESMARKERGMTSFRRNAANADIPARICYIFTPRLRRLHGSQKKMQLFHSSSRVTSFSITILLKRVLNIRIQQQKLTSSPLGSWEESDDCLCQRMTVQGAMRRVRMLLKYFAQKVGEISESSTQRAEVWTQSRGGVSTVFYGPTCYSWATCGRGEGHKHCPIVMLRVAASATREPFFFSHLDRRLSPFDLWRVTFRSFVRVYAEHDHAKYMRVHVSHASQARRVMKEKKKKD